MPRSELFGVAARVALARDDDCEHGAGMCARAICPTCGRPTSVCYCPFVERVATRARVVILQHPREAKMPVNTGRIARLALPNCSLVVGAKWTEKGALPAELRDPEANVALLYPGPGSKDIVSLPRNPPPTLVLLDGTWSQARTMFRDSPPLQKLPMYSFSPSRPSEYRIRREPQEQFVSTIEALAHVLADIEADATLPERLLAPFRAMVDKQVACVRELHQPRARKRRAARVRRSVLAPEILARPSRIVCVAGESNAWPKHMSGRYPRQLVHWVAVRPWERTSLQLVVAPKYPLAPGTVSHVGLDEKTLQGGISPQRFMVDWREFFRDDDVLCSWGFYPINLLREMGWPEVRAHIDLRSVVKQLTRRRWSSLREACERLVGRLPTLDGQVGRAYEQAREEELLVKYIFSRMSEIE